MDRYFDKNCKIVYPAKGEDGQPYVTKPKKKASATPEPDEPASQGSEESKKQKKKALDFIAHLKPQRATESGRLSIKDKPVYQTPRGPERPVTNASASQNLRGSKNPTNPGPVRD